MGGDIPIAYTIKRDGDILDISLVEIDRVLPHEETIPEMLQDLMDRISSDGQLKAPVIVDRESLVVLDGMHRLEALRRLECRFICACFIDYKNPEIKVDRWYRTVSGPFSLEDAYNLADKLGFKLSDDQNVGFEVEANLPLLIFSNSRHLLMTRSSGLSSSFGTVRTLELALKEMGNEIGYETEKSAIDMLGRGFVDVVICPPKIDKEQVIESAIRGKIFIFKSTRHIIPARPLNVNVPLSLLCNNTLSVEEVNEELSKMLHSRKLKHIKPGSTWIDRRYEEDLYIFE